ncbi:MAG: hypothetical protein KDD51_04275 [Bdellovibrionales bacterium]|nr:hypothetical protein [Bdellovibrionales bacterium]
MQRLGFIFLLAIALCGYAAEAPNSMGKAEKRASPAGATGSGRAHSREKQLVTENRAGVNGLREVLKPVPTGDAWLDGILSEWSGFAFDMADEVLRQFGLRKPKPAPSASTNSQ